MNPLALIVEDEAGIGRFVKVSLETQDYRCLAVETGAQAIAMEASHRPDVVVLDLGLPDMDGLRVIEKIRARSAVPIVVVSARGHEREKVEALDAGADDYLTKPFGVAELLARLRVALRHGRREPSPDRAPVFSCGELSIEYDKRRVRLGADEVHLTPTEYNILVLLAQHQGKVLTHKSIVTRVWGGTSVGDAQKLRVTMGNLRRKIEADTAQPRYLFTEIGVGYRMAEE